MKYGEVLTIIENAQEAFDTVREIKSIDKKLKVACCMVFLPILTRMMDKDINPPEEKLKVIQHLSALLIKNDSVYRSGLISKAEFEKNGIELCKNLYQKARDLREEPKKASKIDVLSLRANMQNLNNYS